MSSSSSSRPSGQRQNIFFMVNRQMCEQFPLLFAHSPASSQVRPSGESLVFGKFSQEHSKLPKVFRQTSWHSPRPLFLEHSFMSVYSQDYEQTKRKFHKLCKNETKKMRNCCKRQKRNSFWFTSKKAFILIIMN